MFTLITLFKYCLTLYYQNCFTLLKQYYTCLIIICLNILLWKVRTLLSDQDFHVETFPIKIYKYLTSQTYEQNPNLKWQDECVHQLHCCQSKRIQQQHLLKWANGLLSKTLQKHNGLEGWVQLTKITCLGHITSSSTNLDQISPSEYRPIINFKISSKHQHLH